MPYLRNYRLFISHAWRYSESYDRAVKFLNAAPYFRWSNCSVPESKAFIGLSKARLQEQLRNQIRPAQCVIILAGMYVAYSEWIQFEIDFAVSLNKPILGIVPWGQERTPTAVSKVATELVGWNTNSIVAAIRRIAP